MGHHGQTGHILWLLGSCCWLSRGRHLVTVSDVCSCRLNPFVLLDCGAGACAKGVFSHRHRHHDYKPMLSLLLSLSCIWRDDTSTLPWSLQCLYRKDILHDDALLGYLIDYLYLDRILDYLRRRLFRRRLLHCGRAGATPREGAPAICTISATATVMVLMLAGIVVLIKRMKVIMIIIIIIIIIIIMQT